MKFEIALTTVLAFILPGAIIVIGMALIAPHSREFVVPAIEYVGGSKSLVFASMCLGAGAIIDALRLISTDPLTRFIADRSARSGKKKVRRSDCNRVQQSTSFSKSVDYRSRITEENLPVFTMLIERTYEYYRFNANSSAALLALVMVRAFNETATDRCLWVLIFFFVIAMWTSVRAWRYTRQAVESFVKSTYVQVPET